MNVISGAVFVVAVGLLASACGGDDEQPESADETTESTEAREDEELSELECEGIITFEELSEIVGTEITACEQGGFFEGRSDTSVVQLNIRFQGDNSAPSSSDDARGAGWSGKFTAGICALEAAVGDQRFLVQDLRFGEDCAGLTSDIMDAISARHGS